MAESGKKTIASNRRARHEYHVIESFEAGISLLGPEVKSLREGRANLGDAYGVVERGEVYVHKLHISPYEPATRDNPRDPMRPRRLLLHRHQIEKLHGRVRERGLTLVPLSLYFDENGRVKVELALVKGKKLYDKREDLKRKDAKRDADRAMRGRGGRPRS